MDYNSVFPTTIIDLNKPVSQSCMVGRTWRVEKLGYDLMPNIDTEVCKPVMPKIQALDLSWLCPHFDHLCPGDELQDICRI